MDQKNPKSNIYVSALQFKEYGFRPEEVSFNTFQNQ